MPKFVRRPDARPGEILDAALACFAERGFSATTMEEIGAAAGITAGTIYRYFPSKDLLVGAVVERHASLEWSRGRELSAAHQSSTARQLLLLLLGRWAHHLERGPPAALLTVILREAQQFPDATAQYVSLLLYPGSLAIERLLRHGIERGEFALLDVEATARALALTVMSGTFWQRSFATHLRPLPPGPDPMAIAIGAAVRGLPAPAQEPLAVPPVSATLEEQLVSRPGSAPGLRIVTLRPPDPSRAPPPVGSGATTTPPATTPPPRP